MEYGLILPTNQDNPASAAPLTGLAVEAEALGFDSVWLGEPRPYGRLEPLTLLTALAQATRRVTLGTAALLPAYRDPAQTALVLASLDLIAEGRLVLGVGAGFPGFGEQEFERVGVRWKTRFSHLDDTVTLWREMWTSRPASFHGKVLHYDRLPGAPRPARPGGPPIWLAGATPAALRRTARLYDGWLPYPPDPEDYARGLATIRAAAKRPVTPGLFATVFLDDDPERGERALAGYCQANYGLPLERVRTIQTLLTGPDVAEQLARFAAAGARHVQLRIATVDPRVFDHQLIKVAELLSVLRRTLGDESP
ncbi:LLM class flavin-dependent oxidoreductase [Amycolatopsis cynarae]|uniref:LLM class flavin-dependent oxidoreductase n=1 Tax=Amycolatopsis cynarae TaxID=2995223 RepID=A0ABY7B770_9PSEU|nr:LLM class flavin-dependent oxidoreductase [Amycolatopsis sp. HUAS 11-8]WAL66593.1 LLM class flavin-dependent oxidoreductase [Amycolatopsis sp. HUAS 11-8]